MKPLLIYKETEDVSPTDVTNEFPTSGFEKLL
jgi:hypothetical protein